MEKREFAGIGNGNSQVWGMIEKYGDIDELLILPACEMRMKLPPVCFEKMSSMPPVEEMERFLRFWKENESIDSANETVLSLYHEFTETLSAVDNPTGLYCKAYGCYGGYNSFECDWYASRNCLLKLIEIDYDPFYAATLGYIYYYGRCNDHIPQYPEAYRYFSMAAFGGNIEGKYKIADMFMNGYYVPKHPDTAFGMIKALYDEVRPLICRGKFLTSLADVALRLGNLLRTVCDMSDEQRVCEAYRFLLQADFAIRMRMATYDGNFGDSKVLGNIEKSLEEIRALYRTLPASKDEYLYTIGLVQLSKPDGVLSLNIKHTDRTILRFTPEHNDAENITPRFFLTIPDEDYCGLCDELVFSAEHTGEALPEGDFLLDRIDGDQLYFCGKSVLKLDMPMELLAPNIREEKEYCFVSVRFETNGPLYDFLTEYPDLSRGDHVYVSGKGSIQTAKVEYISRRKASELPFDPNSYPLVEPVKKT